MRRRQLIRTLLCAFLLVTGGVRISLNAQPAPPAVAYQPMDDQQIDTLTSRVALYPDAILSDIFVAATYPPVAEASQWLAAGTAAANVDAQPWDASVKSLTRFPAVLNQMASDAAWTNDLGRHFSISRPRCSPPCKDYAQAIAAGALYTTPQPPQRRRRDRNYPADPQNHLRSDI